MRWLSEWSSFQSAQKKNPNQTNNPQTNCWLPHRKSFTLQNIVLSPIKVKPSVAPAETRELAIILLPNGQTKLRLKASLACLGSEKGMCSIWSLHCCSIQKKVMLGSNFNSPVALKWLVQIRMSMWYLQVVLVLFLLNYGGSMCTLWESLLKVPYVPGHSGPCGNRVSQSPEGLCVFHFCMPMGIKNGLAHTQALLHVNLQTEHPNAAPSLSIFVICEKIRQMFEQWLTLVDVFEKATAQIFNMQ